MATKALVVGIDDYAPVGPGGPDLHGCVADANDLANSLVVLHVVPPIPLNLKRITNQYATRQAILQGFDWLIKGAKEKDLRIFFYAGHGTRVIDKWPKDEPDGYDEAICPHDYATAGPITDDEIATKLKALPPGVRFEAIFDSCFSGSVTREARMQTDLNYTVRYVDPPFDQAIYLDLNPELPLVSPLKRRGVSREPVAVALNHVLWSACRDSQTSKEINIGGTPRGVFTYCFCRVLRKAGVGGLRNIIDAQVTKDVKAMVPDQVPQLEAQRTAMVKPIFGPTRELAEAAAR